MFNYSEIRENIDCAREKETKKNKQINKNSRSTLWHDNIIFTIIFLPSLANRLSTICSFWLPFMDVTCSPFLKLKSLPSPRSNAGDKRELTTYYQKPNKCWFQKNGFYFSPSQTLISWAFIYTGVDFYFCNRFI